LLSFDVPPYESVFLDPSGLLLAPATARVEATYARLRWQPPHARVGAPDHVGVELALVADLLGAGRLDDAGQVIRQHVAFWVPLLVFTVQRLTPDKFYAHLAEATLQALPPPPHYEAHGMPAPPDDEAVGPGLRDLVRHLLTPRLAGMYLTRDDIGQLAQHLFTRVAALCQLLAGACGRNGCFVVGGTLKY